MIPMEHPQQLPRFPNVRFPNEVSVGENLVGCQVLPHNTQHNTQIEAYQVQFHQHNTQINSYSMLPRVPSNQLAPNQFQSMQQQQQQRHHNIVPQFQQNLQQPPVQQQQMHNITSQYHHNAQQPLQQHQQQLHVHNIAPQYHQNQQQAWCQPQQQQPPDETIDIESFLLSSPSSDQQQPSPYPLEDIAGLDPFLLGPLINQQQQQQQQQHNNVQIDELVEINQLLVAKVENMQRKEEDLRIKEEELQKYDEDLQMKDEEMKASLLERSRKEYEAMMARAREMVDKANAERNMHLKRAADHTAQLKDRLENINLESLAWQAKCARLEKRVINLQAKLEKKSGGGGGSGGSGEAAGKGAETEEMEGACKRCGCNCGAAVRNALRKSQKK